MITNFYKLYNKFSTHLILQRSFRHFSALTLTHRCNLSKITLSLKSHGSQSSLYVISTRNMWKAAGRVHKNTLPKINQLLLRRTSENSFQLDTHYNKAFTLS
jgi:hypothetical protein